MKKVIKYSDGKKVMAKAITVWVEASTYEKYKELTKFRVRVPAHLRQVIDKELDRLIELSPGLDAEVRDA